MAEQTYGIGLISPQNPGQSSVSAPKIWTDKSQGNPNDFHTPFIE